jgi:chromosome segregation ATPase
MYAGENTRLHAVCEAATTRLTRNRESVATKTSEPISSCLTSVQSALGELHGTHDEFEGFFGDMFDQLQSLSLELLTRHKCLELGTQLQVEREAAGAEQERRFRECLEELRELNAKVGSAHEETTRIGSEVSSGRQQLLQENVEMHEMREEMRRITTEFRAMREGVEEDRAESSQKLAGIQEHLERLTSISAQAAAAPPLPAHDERLSEVIEATRQQQAAWQQDRDGLEAKLEAERQRSAQQNEALAEQRRLAAQQQAELAGELKRMRSLLEVLLNHINQPLVANTGDRTQTASSDNAALESVLAQFEMLQRDLAERRAGWHKTPAKQ